jgi:hypothetical protein
MTTPFETLSECTRQLNALVGAINTANGRHLDSWLAIHNRLSDLRAAIQEALNLSSTQGTAAASYAVYDILNEALADDDKAMQNEKDLASD